MGICACTLFAQSYRMADDVNPLDTNRSASLGFTRVLNTFFWDGIVRGAYKNDGWSFLLLQSMKSRLFRSSYVFRQVEYAGVLSAERQVTDWLSYNLKLHSQSLGTNQSYDVGSMAVHRALIGTSLNPFQSWSLGLLTGYERNTQGAFIDDGTTGELWLKNPSFHFEEFSSSLLLDYEYSHLTRRKPYDATFQCTLYRDFHNGVSDSLLFSYQKQKREFYTAVESSVRELMGMEKNILERTYDNLQLGNSLTYRVHGLVHWHFTTLYTRRNILRAMRYKVFHPGYPVSQLDTRIEENTLILQSDLAWNISTWCSTVLGFQYSEREESHSILEDPAFPITVIAKQKSDARRLENLSRRTTASLRNNFALSIQDSLMFDNSISILRYDTPDTTNTNDRDELWINAGIEYIHKFSPAFRTSIRIEGYLNHLVYLSRKQSANNSWNRVIRFEWRNMYQPSLSFQTLMRAEILANYTVSDYEQQIASVKSYVFRQFRVEDTTVVSLTNRVGMNCFVGVRFSERGILRWREFRERPEQEFREYSGECGFFYLPYSLGMVKIGYRIFRQERYTYVIKRKVQEQILVSLGPTVRCTLTTQTCTFRIDGWYEIQRINSKTVARIPNVSLTTMYTL